MLQEVASDLISDAAASVQMDNVPSLPQAEIVPIEPEALPPEATTPIENAETLSDSHPESSGPGGSTGSATEERTPASAESVEEAPTPRPLRRFDTDEPEKNRDRRWHSSDSRSGQR